jgi:hypothetical protein
MINQETFTLPLDLTNFKEDYNRERESISEAIEEVLRNYDKNRQND